jgi:hypothetical protein
VNWESDWLNGADDGVVLSWLGEDDAEGFPGSGPEGVAIAALSLENGYTVTHRWVTDVIKTRSGKEQRISRNDRPRESYSGAAILLGRAITDLRDRLARIAAGGEPILLGLQHEEMFLRADAVGTAVYVYAEALALADWTNAGQRVQVIREDEDGTLESVEGVIQSATADSITLDVEPGELGAYGGRIMPMVPILLEPQQDFERIAEVEAEIWKLSGRSIVTDFAMTLSFLALGPLTGSTGLAAAVVTARSGGLAPTLSFVNAFDNGAGYINETSSAVFIHFEAGVTTIQNLIDLLATSTLVAMSGATSPLSTMLAGDAFASQTLAGGALQGPVGSGVSLVEHDGSPVWDFPIIANGTVTDSIHALTEILDYGGAPYTLGLADVADWGRGVAVQSEHREDWQWLKLFMATVKGRQKAFWLPTYRDDLPFVSKAANVITVEGDVAAWYPAQRQHVQVEETSDTITRAEITAAVDNGDGTWTLTIGTTLATSSVRRVSWLERCRFESDEFTFAFNAQGFSFGAIARVVQQ